MPIQLCVLGHSGVGKSPLSKLFKKEHVFVWQPRRQRASRNDADYVISKEEYDRLLQQCQKGSPEPLNPEQGENNLQIFKDYSFFTVRTTDQCLAHQPAREAIRQGKTLWVEIYAPVLADMLTALKKKPELQKWLPLQANSLIVILLNPMEEEILQMKPLYQGVSLATLTAILERSRAKGNPIDLADALRRMERLGTEVEAWQSLASKVSKIVECRKWPHFEFRYSVPSTELASAKTELIRARATLLKALEKRQLADQVANIMQSPEEIDELDAIV